jgi:hypothetical protein
MMSGYLISTHGKINVTRLLVYPKSAYPQLSKCPITLASTDFKLKANKYQGNVPCGLTKNQVLNEY